MATSTVLTQERIDTQPQSAATFLTLAIRASGLFSLVVGGGRVGTRKAITLCRAGAKVTVLSPEISPRLREFVHRGQIVWCQSKYAPSQIVGFRLVVAATADDRLNRQIGQDAENEGILSCVVSSADSSCVIFPAVCSDGDVTVAVHSQGKDCRKSQAVRNRIAVWMSASRQLPKVQAGRDRGGKGPKCPGELDAREKASPGMGKVYIVGAGPGAADLISLRGYHALRSADAILVDRLIPATFLEDLGISSTGKLVQSLGSEEPHWSQEKINRWLVATASTGRTVARLKGGDPFIFGRGDSEIESLANSGIPWEVIPGIAPRQQCSAVADCRSPGTARGVHSQWLPHEWKAVACPNRFPALTRW